MPYIEKSFFAVSQLLKFINDKNNNVQSHYYPFKIVYRSNFADCYLLIYYQMSEQTGEDFVNYDSG